MKKLIAMIGAVAMSFGLFADATPFTTSFDTGDAGVNGTEYTSEQAGWSGLTDPLTLKAYDPETDPAYVYDETDRRFAKDNLQYLPLETERTNALNHAIGEGNVFVDQLVRFTGFEDPQTNLVEGVKIAVWMGEFFNDEETSAETNLYVTVGSDYLEGQIAVKLDGNYEINKWYRLTIKSLGDIFNTGVSAPRAGFSIWIDGVKKAIASDDAHKDNLISRTGQLKDAAASAYAKGQLFPAVSFGENEIALNSFGYNGIGAIDDVYVDDVGPDFTVEEYTFTIADDDRVSVKSVYAGGKELDEPYTVAPGTAVTITWEAKDGYKIRGAATQTTAIDTPDQEVAVDDKQVEILDVVATVTNGQTVNKFAEDELEDMMAGLKDGDVVEFLENCYIGDDLFSADTTIDVADGDWTINAVGDLILYSDIEKNVVIKSEDDVYFASAIAAGYTVDATEVTGSFMLDDSFEIEGTLKVADSFSDEGNKITLVEDGKVWSSEPLVYQGDESIFANEEEIAEKEEDDGYAYTIAAEPPPPAESGFMIMIGETETYFDYLQDAIDAAKDGDTITAVAPLLTQKGVFVAANKFPTTGLTIDLAGLDYIVDKPGAGDSGTETQAFHFKSGNIITIKDGQISCPASMKDYTWPNPGDVKGIARMLNNYGTLTLENVDIDASNMAASFYKKSGVRYAGDSWAVSAAKTGDLTLTGGSSITSREAVEGYASYAFDTDTGVSVTLNDATIYGDVQLAAGNLTLTAGTIDGELVAAPGVTLGTVTKSADFDVNAPAGYFWDNNVLAKCAAEIDGTYYNTLAAAFTAAQADDEIVLLKDVQIEACIAVDKKVTLNIGDFDITPKAAFTRPTGSKITIDAMFAVRYGGDFTVVGNAGVIDCSAFPTIYSPIKLTEYDETETYDGSTKAKLTVNANLKGYYYAITGNGKRPGTEITINGGLLEGTLVNESAGIYHPQGGTLTINGGTIKGDTGLYIKAGDCICSVGSGATIIATGTKKDYVAKKSGFQSTGDAFLIDNADYPGGEPSADIEDGEFISANGAAVASYAKAGFDPIVGFVTGGTFTGAVKIDDAIAGGDYAFGPFTPGEPQSLVDAVAKVNDVNYATFDAAWAAAQENDEIVLLADCTFGTAASAQVKLNKNLKLTLNGHVLTVKNKKYDRIYVVDNKTLTVDGLVEGSKLIGTLYAGIRVSEGHYSEGNIVIKGGTYVASDHNKYGLAAIQSNGGCENSSITATGATFIGGNMSVEPTDKNRDQQGIAAVLAAGGTYTFTDCEFTGRTGIYAKAGTLTLDDCTVAANGTQFAPVANTDGSDPTGDAIIFDSNSSYNGDLTLVVTGDSSISSVNGYAFQETVTKGSASATLAVSIADTVDVDGKVVLSDAFAAAVKAGTAAITGYVATVNNIAYQTVAAALAEVKILEDAEDFPITVAALAAGGITITDSDRTAKIAAGVTITIPEAKHWTVNGVLGYAGAIEGTVAAEDIEKIEDADITIGQDATVAVGLASSVDASFFTSSDESCEVKQIAVTDTYKVFALETKMLTLTVKEVEHTKVEVTYDGTTDTTNGVYTLAYGTEYLVKYTPVAGYQGSSTHQGTLFDNTMVNQPKPTAINYTITYTFTGVAEGDVEKVVNTNPKTYTIESETITFVDASCEGYTFKGWDIAKIDAGSTGNKTITGTFEKAEDPLPPWVPSGEKEAYNTWKQGPGATESDFTGTTEEVAAKMEDSFLLDCEPTEAALQSAKANFKITSITKDASGNWVVLTVGQEDNTAYRNGLIKLEAFESVGCTGTPVTPGTQPQLFWKASLVHPTAN